MDDVKSGQYASRDEAYKNINILVDEALREDKPYFQLSLVSPKKKFVFTQDLPENILDKLLYTSIHADMGHQATRFDVGEAFGRLNPGELRDFLKIVLDNQKWFIVRYQSVEIHFIER